MSNRLPNQDSSDPDGLLASALDGSYVATVLRAPVQEDSRASRAARWLSRTVRNSFLYRWLTKEPEPEVIVIDLRETWTVGPVVRALDAVVAWTLPAWNESTLKRGFDLLAVHLSRVADTRYGNLLVKLLEPPEPPGAVTKDDTETNRPTDEDE